MGEGIWDDRRLTLIDYLIHFWQPSASRLAGQLAAFFYTMRQRLSISMDLSSQWRASIGSYKARNGVMNDHFITGCRNAQRGATPPLLLCLLRSPEFGRGCNRISHKAGKGTKPWRSPPLFRLTSAVIWHFFSCFFTSSYLPTQRSRAQQSSMPRFSKFDDKRDPIQIMGWFRWLNFLHFRLHRKTQVECWLYASFYILQDCNIFFEALWTAFLVRHLEFWHDCLLLRLTQYNLMSFFLLIETSFQTTFTDDFLPSHK